MKLSFVTKLLPQVLKLIPEIISYCTPSRIYHALNIKRLVYYRMLLSQSFNTTRAMGSGQDQMLLIHHHDDKCLYENACDIKIALLILHAALTVS